MASIDAFALGRSDLNRFLFAEIGIEPSGMTPSVVSALGRLGLDPWTEAARLAGLPRASAVDGLAGIISAMPASRWPLADATQIAARLVALLPRRDALMVPTDVKTTDHIGVNWQVWVVVVAVLVVLAILLMQRTSSADEVPRSPTSMSRALHESH